MMSYHTMLRLAVVSALFLGLASLSTGAEKGKNMPAKDKEQGTVHTVIASVQQSAGFIQAELVPGLFTVRKGFKASNLKFSLISSSFASMSKPHLGASRSNLHVGDSLTAPTAPIRWIP